MFASRFVFVAFTEKFEVVLQSTIRFGSWSQVLSFGLVIWGNDYLSLGEMILSLRLYVMDYYLVVL